MILTSVVKKFESLDPDDFGVDEADAEHEAEPDEEPHDDKAVL